MAFGGLPFTVSVLAKISELVETNPGISRFELARQLCATFGWRAPNGKLKEMSCRKGLVELERRGMVRLPPVVRPFPTGRNPESFEITIPPVSCDLAELGEVVVRPVDRRDRAQARLWRGLLDRYHYLGSGPLCGAQIRYLVESETHGPLGALAFNSAAWSLAERDRFIGWSPAARIANIQKVVCNSRMLIPPSVQVPNLASHALGLALARLPADWEERYAVHPVLVETFVDPSRFRGVAYQASNWIEVGMSAGRRDGVSKRIFVRPLAPKWRKTLTQVPEIPLGAPPRPEAPANWAEEEFGTVRLWDERLKQRLYTVAQDFYHRPQADIPEACGSKARTMGAYRLFQHSAVTMDILLTAHTEATVRRCQEHEVVLAPQDTTTLDYNTHLQTEGLGPTNGVGKGGWGLLLHDTLAFTPEGTPLGVLDARCWARKRRKMDRKAENQPIEQKESVKWLRSFQKVADVQRLCPETTFVSMGDRESDVYELFREAVSDPKGPKLLVRSDRYRQRRVEEEEEEKYLWEFMARREAAAHLELHLPRRGSSSARDASLELRHALVELKPPRRCASEPSIPLWAVYLGEPNPPEDVKHGVEWLLLTTAPVHTIEDAKERVEWYAGRWGIEVYHRTLKSGCRIRNRQLGTAGRLEACLGVDMAVAWRIYHLAWLGRETPEAPCTIFFSDLEWKTLCCLATRKPIPPPEPPTMTQAVRMVGQLGGHLGRKSDGPPGTQVLWRGLQRLESAVEAFHIVGFIPGAKPTDRAPP